MLFLEKSIVLKRVLNLPQILHCWIQIRQAVLLDPYYSLKNDELFGLEEPIQFLNTVWLHRTPRKVGSFLILLISHIDFFETLDPDELHH